MQLRPYQQRTLDQLYEWWMSRPGENPLVTVPTAGGKSVIIAELVRLMFDTWPEDHPRTVVLVPSKELAEQNAQKLRALLPTHINVGFYSASIGQKRPDADVIVATIGSIYKAAHILGNIKCVVIDECFPGNTRISTTAGSKRIDQIRPGDFVCTATGVGMVHAVSRREAKQLLKVRMSDGTEICVTDNHPFFTNSGWKCAKDLVRGDGVVRLQDMPELWRGLSTLDEDSEQWIDSLSIETGLSARKVLLNILLQEAGERHVGARCKREDGYHVEEDWARAICSWWERAGVDGASESSAFNFGQWLDTGTVHQDGGAEGQRGISAKLQGGHRTPHQKNCHRTGWQLASRQAQVVGSEERCLAGFTWVDSVSIEELPSAGFVFNLQVGGHPSYFAEGILVHNCHLVNQDGSSEGRYRRFLADLGKYCDFRVVGYTATPFRGNGVWLTEGDDPLFHGVASRITVSELLEQGFLSPLIRPIDAVQTRIDTEGIKTTSGDYNIGELSERVNGYLPAAAAETCTLAAERKKWIAFCPTVANAHTFARLLQQRGITAEVVTGDTPKAEREALIARFRAGEIRCLITVLALATGFDVPDVDCIVWLRPTRSPVLYVQGAGRGFRIAPGKTDCLWLDFSDTTERMGPVDTIKGRKRVQRSDEARESPMRTCDECGERVPVALKECPSCGYEFPVEDKVQEVRRASNAAILSLQQPQIKLTTYPVDRVTYRLHRKEGKRDSIRVDYWSGLQVVASEWVCPIHGGFATDKAQRWIDQRTPDREYRYHACDPAGEAIHDIKDGSSGCWSVQGWIDAFAHELLVPAAVVVNESGKFKEIVKHLWEYEHEPTNEDGHDSGAQAGAGHAGGDRAEVPELHAFRGSDLFAAPSHPA